MRKIISKETLSNNLFGSDSKINITWKGILLFSIFSVVIGVLLILRRSDALLNPQFWAEDGNLFFYQAFYGEASIFTPYQGYFHVIPRVIALFANLFPVVYTPLIYNSLALVLAAICTAWFALPYFRHIINDYKLRIVTCVLIALMPAVSSVLLNITNIQWYLLIWCSLVCLQPFSGTNSKIAIMCTYLIFVFSSVVTMILTPLWILRALLVPKDRKISIAMTSVHVIYTILISVSLNPVSENQAPIRIFDFLATIMKLIIARVGMMGLLGPQFMENYIPRSHYTFIIAGISLLILVVALIWRGRSRPSFLIHTSLFAYFIFVSVAMYVFSRNRHPHEDLYFIVGGARYFFFGTAIFYIWILNILDKLRSDYLIRYGAIGILILLAFVVKNNIFFVQHFENTDWPRWAAGLEQVRKSGSKFPFSIPINPRPWMIPGSHNYPPDTLTIIYQDEPQVINEMEWTGNSWRSIGDNSYLLFEVEQPRYVYSISLQYSLKSYGVTASNAQLAWRLDPRSDFKHDLNMQLLPETEGKEIVKVLLIADYLKEFRIDIRPNASDFKLSQITLKASP